MILSKFKKCVIAIVMLLPLTIFANENKIALIIGNDSYKGDFPSLPTSVNDAQEMDKCLKALGYETILVLDASREQMMDALDIFENKTKNAAVGVLFYSGHAVTLHGESHLIPAKTNLKIDDVRLEQRCIGINAISWKMRSQCKKSILFLDACRSIVYEQAKYEQTKGGWTIPPIKNSRNNPQIICYATGLDDVASTGSERLSPFTQVLTSHLFDKESFQHIWQNYIESEVLALSDQKPDIYGMFADPFYFNPNGVEESKSDGYNTQKEITINVTPSTAKIKFGNKEYSSGNTLLYSVGSTYTYTVTQDGYVPYSGVLKVTQSSPSTVEVKLKEAEKAVIEVRCNEYAAVYVDNEYVGMTPCTITTIEGQHSLRISKDGWLSDFERLHLTPGENKTYTAYLSRDIGDYWLSPEYDGANHINYHYSPKYQLGLSYMHRPEDSRFSYGLTLASSFGWFKGMSPIVSVSSSVSVGVKTDFVTVDVDGVPTACEKTTIAYSGDVDDKYTPEIDPYNEAKHYDANALVLGNVGYHITNGIMIEAGVGAGYHQDRYHMETTYSIIKTETTNLATGELVKDPEYQYTATGDSKWFRNSSKWSPAVRLGAKFFIPLDGFEEYSITIGGGYTYLPVNNKFSSWDANIGFCWYF